MPDAVTRDFGNQILPRAFVGLFDTSKIDMSKITFSEDTIAFFEDLLNGKFCPYDHLLRSSVSRELIVSSINRELAMLSMGANTLVSDAISRRTTNVKGCLADPFVYALYGHSHRDETDEFGYSGNMGGFIAGIDNVWAFPNERYLRLGVALGYVYGKTKFSGQFADVAASARHNICALELFAAYESFNDKHLKTNVGLTLGYHHGTDKLHRNTPDSGGANEIAAAAAADEKLVSNNIFLGLEFIKNLCAYGKFQLGPWLRANYGRVAQEGHKGPMAEYVSPANHNVLTTVVGIGVENEILNRENSHKKTALSLKIGWECRPIHKHSSITALIDDSTYEVVTPLQPSKNSAILSLGASQKLNDHWSLAGSYTGRFNKDTSSHSLAGGVEYSF
jgi:outer membrane autotransporter protein